MKHKNIECSNCKDTENVIGETWEEHDDQEGGTKVCGDYQCLSCGYEWSIGQ